MRAASHDIARHDDISVASPRNCASSDVKGKGNVERILPALGKVSGSRSVVVEVTPQCRRKVSIHTAVLEVLSFIFAYICKTTYLIHY